MVGTVEVVVGTVEVVDVSVEVVDVSVEVVSVVEVEVLEDVVDSVVGLVVVVVIGDGVVVLSSGFTKKVPQLNSFVDKPKDSFTCRFFCNNSNDCNHKNNRHYSQNAVEDSLTICISVTKQAWN